MAYLDHAATSPLRPEARAAMAAHWDLRGNPSSLHAGGRAARRVVEEARESLADDLGARPSDVIFTSGGTESDNLAIKGLFWARRTADSARRRIVCSPAEHHAVLDSVTWLADRQGAEVTWLELDPYGAVTPAALETALAGGSDVALATCMWANNEIGTISPVEQLAASARAAGVPLHADAVQALGQVPVDVRASGVDAVTITAHKVGGPVGIGALILRPGVGVDPILHGGGQDRDVRSGTLDAVAAAGFAAAVRAATVDLQAGALRLAALRADLVEGIRRAVPDVIVNGASDPDRLPANVHLSFPGCEGESLLMLLDAQGIECSTGSACTAGVARPSHVLLALGVAPDVARSSLRFSLGHTSTAADVAEVLDVIAAAVTRARGAVTRTRTRA